MKKITFKNSLFLLSLLLIFNSCEKEQQEVLIDSESQQEHFVSSKEAKSIAMTAQFNNPEDTKENNSEVESITSVPDENGEIVYYIINYQNKGFIIISADKRINPVLAYSDISSFPTDIDKYPSGLVGWLANSKEIVKDVRKNGELPPDFSQWEQSSIRSTIHKISGTAENFQSDSKKEDPIDPGHCDNSSTRVGPLLSTVWGQWGGYNDQTPHLNCSNNDGRAPTGCVATAMAQIMKYHEYPSNYNWPNMPDNFGTSSTASLMADIGTSVGMDYSCDVSGADTEDDVPGSFINDFGYQSASYADYNRNTVTNNLSNDRPVILRGGSNNGWWIFGVYDDGHAWVCDGFSQSWYCGTSSLYLHMNWGWGDSQTGRSLNGWYAYNNWDTGENSFNYQKGMIVNIIP